MSLTYKIELPGYPAKDVKDASRVSTDEVLRKYLGGVAVLAVYSDPTRYWIQRETKEDVQTIRFAEVKSACIRCGETRIAVAPQDALNDAVVVAQLQTAHPGQTFQQSDITHTYEDGALIALIDASVLVAQTCHEADAAPLDALLDETDNRSEEDDLPDDLASLDLPEVQLPPEPLVRTVPAAPNAPNVVAPIAIAPLLVAQADAPQVEKPMAAKPAAPKVADEVEDEEDDTEEQEDEVQDVVTRGTSQQVALATTSSVHQPGTYDQSLKTITVVIAPNSLDVTRPNISYSLSVGGLYLKVGMTSLDALGTLPVPIQLLLDDAASRWEALLQAKVERDAAAAAKKTADAAESKRKAEEARTTTSAWAKANAGKKGKAKPGLSAAPPTKPEPATAGEADGKADVEDPAEADPAEAHAAQSNPSQMGLFINP